jgi:hypothetical protein
VPRAFILASIVVFALGVWALTNFGKQFMTQLDVCDATVSYLDLARQASDHRQYEQADKYYKQALIFARQNDSTGQAEYAMLLTYAKFSFEKRHDLKLATELQERAAQLRKKLAMTHPT